MLETGLFLPNLKRGGYKEYEIINWAKRRSNLQAVIFYALIIIILSVMCPYAYFGHEIITIYNANSTELVTKRVFPYNIYLPFDKYEHYNFSFFYIVFACMFLGLYTGSCDCLITGLMVHVRAQIFILKNSIENILERSFVDSKVIVLCRFIILYLLCIYFIK